MFHNKSLFPEPPAETGVRKGATLGVRAASKTRKSARTRARILEAAAELVGERGGVGFQMSEIAQRCEISKGALYYYFRDRDAILSEVFDQSIDEFVRRLEGAASESATPAEVLARICRAFAEGVSEGGTLVFAIGHDLGNGVGLITQIESRLGQVISMVEGQLERARADGLIRRDIDAHFSAHCVAGAFFLAATERIKEGGVLDTEVFADQLAEFVMMGVGSPA